MARFARRSNTIGPDFWGTPYTGGNVEPDLDEGIMLEHVLHGSLPECRAQEVLQRLKADEDAHHQYYKYY